MLLGIIKYYQQAFNEVYPNDVFIHFDPKNAGQSYVEHRKLIYINALSNWPINWSRGTANLCNNVFARAESYSLNDF